MKKLTFVFLGILFFTVSCKKEDVNSSSLSKFEISNASSLIISSSSEKSGEGNKLFKITDEGYLEEVTYTDKEGNKITVVNTPLDIFNINTEYLIVEFGSQENHPESAYIVRKSDGAAFTLDNCGYPLKSYNYFKNFNPVQVDNNLNIYYLAHYEYISRKIVKVELNPSDNLTSVDVSPTNEHIEVFAPDSDGNIIYYGRKLDEIDGTISNFRIKMTNGGVYNLPYNTMNFWRANDGNLYYSHPNHWDSIFKISIDENFEVNERFYGEIKNLDFQKFQSDIINLSDKTYIIGVKGIYEVYNTNNKPTKVEGLNLSTIKASTSSNDFIYLSGNNLSNSPVLLKLDPRTNTATELLAPGEYDIYSMSASANNIISISALRMNDGKKILGEIGENGVLKIVDEESNMEVIVLKRIN